MSAPGEPALRPVPGAVDAAPAVQGEETRFILPLGDGRSMWVNHDLPSGWLNLFNRPEYFRLHSRAGRAAYYFQLGAEAERKAIAAAHFTETEAGHFVSPARGSFGAFDFDAGLPIEVVEQFVGAVTTFLAGRGARRLRVADHPFAYDAAKSSVLFNVLLRQGFAVANHELSYAIPVDGATFVERLDRGNVKRLNKCRRQGMVTRHLPPEEYSAAYEVIVENRARRGFPVTMTFAQIEEMVRLFAGAVHCFGVFDGDRMVASSVCIRVSEAVLYVFYWGDVAGVETLSPVTFLAESLYDFSRANGYALLDIGTSTVAGVPNAGLVRYKRNLGCEESLKLTYERTLAGVQTGPETVSPDASRWGA
jgi:hypothetical protein